MEKELLEREALKTKPACLRAKIILREMRKCPMAETEGNAMTLHTLLPHTNRHLGYVDERTLGASNHHLFDIIVFFQVFLRILTGLITSHVQLALNTALEGFADCHTRGSVQTIVCSIIDDLYDVALPFRNGLSDERHGSVIGNCITNTNAEAVVSK